MWCITVLLLIQNISGCENSTFQNVIIATNLSIQSTLLRVLLNIEPLMLAGIHRGILATDGNNFPVNEKL